MELSAKVAALDEEIVVLKGEIKAILQEVRTALLARDNPFAPSVTEAPFRPVPAPPAPAPAILQEAPANVVTLQAFPQPQQAAPQQVQSAPFAAVPPPIEVTPIAQPPRRPPNQGWDARTLAGVMAWTQETAERFNAWDFRLVLSLARYSRLIDQELESTLTDVAAGIPGRENSRRASVSDFVLVLRQLEAVLGAMALVQRRAA